jgi:hypothetical protein
VYVKSETTEHISVFSPISTIFHFTHAETDQSIIVEIMEYVENTDDIAIK